MLSERRQTRTAFDDAFSSVVGLDGAYCADPINPSEYTRYGLRQSQYLDENLHEMTLARAKAIWERDYWRPLGCDIISNKFGDLRRELFELAAHSEVGVEKALRTLQKSLGVSLTGVFDVQTRNAMEFQSTPHLDVRWMGARLELLTTLDAWPVCGRAWARRLSGRLMSL